MYRANQKILLLLCIFCISVFSKLPGAAEGLPIWYWTQPHFVNFGDYLSQVVVERIIGCPTRFYKKRILTPERKLLAIGSILYFAGNNDVIWGSGYSGKQSHKKDFSFSNLDVRAVRGPITRDFLQTLFGISCPEIYGDPALLFPYLFPEFTKQENPKYDYIVIPHFTEEKLFPKELIPNVVYPTEPWNEVIEKILDSKFVIASSLHGIIIAEAYGIPARMLRVTETEPLLKYQDYYLGTNRSTLTFATSIEEALSMGGETPFKCDLEKLYNAFPFEFWPSSKFIKLNYSNEI